VCTDLDPVDARVLLQEALGLTHAQLIAHSERRLGEAEQARFLALTRRRLAGEPVAYILGRREFYGRDFRVTPSVLIPRPDTELLVDLALERMRSRASPHVLDLGTGSGCIALTLALEVAESRVYAVDASADALAVATENRAALGVANVTFLHGSWFLPLPDMRFDLIVGNPPYIAEADPHLAQGDLRFEPRGALCAGMHGLDDLERIIAHAPEHLGPGGWLLLEHGYDQAGTVGALLDRAGLEDRFVAPDLAGVPRVSGGRKAP
jgi:release factor glutamine methyltransferase